MADPVDIKQACLDLSNAAMALFDEVEKRGMEGGWTASGVMALVKMSTSYERIREPFARMATRRMLALGVSREQLAEMVVRRSGVS